MSELQLTHGQRRRLRRQLQRTPHARVYRRTLAVLEYSRGRSAAEIAHALGVTRQSVHNWVEAYRQAHDPADLCDQERSGRPSQWTEERRALLQTLLGQRPDELGYLAVDWTVPLLQEQIERSTGARLSEDTVRRELERLDYVWKRARYALDPDPEREKKTPHPPLGPGPAAPQRGAGRG